MPDPVCRIEPLTVKVKSPGRKKPYWGRRTSFWWVEMTYGYRCFCNDEFVTETLLMTPEQAKSLLRLKGPLKC